MSALLDSGEEGSATDGEHEVSTGELDPMALLLSENYMSGCLDRSPRPCVRAGGHLGASLEDLQTGEDASNDMSAHGPWWVYRLMRRLLGDPAQTSISASLPAQPPPRDDPVYAEEHLWPRTDPHAALI